MSRLFSVAAVLFAMLVSGSVIAKEYSVICMAKKRAMFGILEWPVFRSTANETSVGGIAITVTESDEKKVITKLRNECEKKRGELGKRFGYKPNGRIVPTEWYGGKDEEITQLDQLNQEFMGKCKLKGINRPTFVRTEATSLAGAFPFLKKECDKLQGSLVVEDHAVNSAAEYQKKKEASLEWPKTRKPTKNIEIESAELPTSTIPATY